MVEIEILVHDNLTMALAYKTCNHIQTILAVFSVKKHYLIGWNFRNDICHYK